MTMMTRFTFNHVARESCIDKTIVLVISLTPRKKPKASTASGFSTHLNLFRTDVNLLLDAPDSKQAANHT
jgi:hypothetical protein